MTPWEFPGISAELHDKVVAAIRKDRTAEMVVQEAAQFTILQRLFRAALEGEFGEGFPIEKLTALVPVVAPPPRAIPVRTPRWDILDPGGVKFTAARAKLLTEMMTAVESLAPPSTGSGAAILAPISNARDRLVRRAEAGDTYLTKLTDLARERKAAGGGGPPAGWQANWDRLWADWQAADEAWLKEWDGAVPTAALHVRPDDGRHPAGWSPAQSAALRAANLGLLEADYWLRQRQHLNLRVDDRQQQEQLLAGDLPAW